jgi:hypothetical protein
VLCQTTRAKPVQTFDEIRRQSAKPVSSEKQAVIDEVLKAMKSEFIKEKATILKANKQNKSVFPSSIFLKYKINITNQHNCVFFLLRK